MIHHLPKHKFATNTWIYIYRVFFKKSNYRNKHVNNVISTFNTQGKQNQAGSSCLSATCKCSQSFLQRWGTTSRSLRCSWPGWLLLTHAISLPPAVHRQAEQDSSLQKAAGTTPLILSEDTADLAPANKSADFLWLKGNTHRNSTSKNQHFSQATSWRKNNNKGKSKHKNCGFERNKILILSSAIQSLCSYAATCRHSTTCFCSREYWFHWMAII